MRQPPPHANDDQIGQEVPHEKADPDRQDQRTDQQRVQRRGDAVVREILLSRLRREFVSDVKFTAELTQRTPFSPKILVSRLSLT